MTQPVLGATLRDRGVNFSVWSSAAECIWVSIFDVRGQVETERLELTRGEGDVYSAFVPGLGEGTRYGFRADGPFVPSQGLWFDPDKLLVDPYAVAIDGPYRYDRRLTARRGAGADTAHLVPKAVVTALPPPSPLRPPHFREGGLFYELSVRSFSMRNPAVPAGKRGTLAALAEPSVIEHLVRLGVDAVELMPITAWIDERHLLPLGLSNAWGYNPVTYMALDPRLAPNGMADLRQAVDALHDVGIGVILDVVFNHTGESDEFGPTLSLRGLDSRAYYRHRQDGTLVNDTGCGNTLDCSHPAVQRLVPDSLRHFVRHAGVDGFRFDLAPILGRDAAGFDAKAQMLSLILADPEVGSRVLVAEPWDIGPGGYQLGNFPGAFLEWNDRYRDDIRRFWRGDRHGVGDLATRLAGSSDVFGKDGVASTRSVGFVAAHDGMTLADLVAYRHKHNFGNGEGNRDGHDENLSWNCGHEGLSVDPDILAARRRDQMALLATLFASRGAILLTAGDEFGRSQAGNNNAYAQDNEVTWLDWESRDLELEAFAAELAAARRRLPTLSSASLLTGQARKGGLADVTWFTEGGTPLGEAEWHDPDRRCLGMMLAGQVGVSAVLVNGTPDPAAFALPAGDWKVEAAPPGAPRQITAGRVILPPRAVIILSGELAATATKDA